jgi:hypothetical protein
MPPNKVAASYRLSPDALGLINRLAEYLGLSQGSVLEVAVRKLARAELPPDQQPGEPPPAGRRRTRPKE